MQFTTTTTSAPTTSSTPITPAGHLWVITCDPTIDDYKWSSPNNGVWGALRAIIPNYGEYVNLVLIRTEGAVEMGFKFGASDSASQWEGDYGIFPEYPGGGAISYKASLVERRITFPKKAYEVFTKENFVWRGYSIKSSPEGKWSTTSPTGEVLSGSNGLPEALASLPTLKYESQHLMFEKAVATIAPKATAAIAIGAIGAMALAIVAALLPPPTPDTTHVAPATCTVIQYDNGDC